MLTEKGCRTLKKGETYHLDEVYSLMSLLPYETYDVNEDEDTLHMHNTVKIKYTVEVVC